VRPIRIIHLGLVDYGEAYAFQRDLVERRGRHEIPDTLVLLEHPPVITVGRGGCGDLPEPEGIPIHHIERGGAATYHGPGQVVAYPILYLPEGERDLHGYLRGLEEGAIRTCADLGVAAGRTTGKTGVWVGEKKIASVGVAVSRWVTYHGLALNVDLDLSPFRRFRPCGLDGDVMTSLAECGVPEDSRSRASSLLAENLATALGLEEESPGPAAVGRLDSSESWSIAQ
jgi:lipoate-protein ligase B